MIIKTLFFVSQVEGNFYVNEPLEKLMFEELRNACRGGGQQSFTSSSSLTCGIHLHLQSILCLYFRRGRIPAGHETNRERGSAARDRTREYHDDMFFTNPQRDLIM